MNKYPPMFKNIMNISAYKALHRLLQRQPDQLFGITDQELDDVIIYDILSIMSSHYNMMNKSQKKCVVELLESEMGLRNLSLVLDNLSASMKEEVYVPYLLKLIKRVDIHPIVTAAYLVLFKFCIDLISSHMINGLYVCDYLALLNVAYFSVIADGLGISNSYMRYMKDSYGSCSYDDFVDSLYEKYSDDIDWDLEIDLNGIDKYLEENKNTTLFEKPNDEEDTLTGAADYFDIVNIVAGLRGEDIVRDRIRENNEVLSSVLRETKIRIIKRDIIAGFDCCFLESEDYGEEYILIQRHSSYYRMLIYDKNSFKRLLEDIKFSSLLIFISTTISYRHQVPGSPYYTRFFEIKL